MTPRKQALYPESCPSAVHLQVACERKQFCQAIADAGGATAFVRLCNSVDFSDAAGSFAARTTAGSLAMLSQEPAAAAAVVAAGGIPALVRALDAVNGAGGGGVDSDVPRALATAINNLAATDGRAVTAASRAGAPAALVQLLRSSREMAVQAVAAAAISIMAEAKQSAVCHAIARADGIAVLASRLSSRDSSLEGQQRLLMVTCRALCHLACDSPDRALAIAATGCVPRLVRLLRSGGAATADAGKALVSLAASGAADAVVAAGAIPVLVKQLRSGQDSFTQLVAAAAFVSLAHSHHAEAVLGAGAGPLLEQLRQASPDETVQEYAAEALEALSSHAAAPSGSGQAALPASRKPRAPRVCAGCGATDGKLRRCIGCLMVRYCGTDCSVGIGRSTRLSVGACRPSTRRRWPPAQRHRQRSSSSTKLDDPHPAPHVCHWSGLPVRPADGVAEGLMPLLPLFLYLSLVGQRSPLLLPSWLLCLHAPLSRPRCTCLMVAAPSRPLV